MASTAVSALLTSGSTYLIDRAASNTGQAVTGNAEDKDRSKKDVNNFVWNSVGNVTDTSVFTGYLNDIARNIFARGSIDTGSQVETTMKNATNGIANVVRKIAGILEAPSGTKKLERAKEAILPALRSVQDPLREMIGDPTVPLTREAGRAERAATFESKPTKYAQPGAEPEIKQMIDAGKIQEAPREVQRQRHRPAIDRAHAQQRQSR